MRGRKTRRALQASFVVTVARAPACKPSTTGGTSGGDVGTWHVQRRGEGCFLYQSTSCPENATCNPPPPMEVDCPPSAEGDAGTSTSKAPPSPPGKEGWV